MESSPILQRIRELSPTIQEDVAVPGLPSTQISGAATLAPTLREEITEPPGPQAAAQPATALTGVGAPPPALITARAVPPPAVGRMETRQVPRKIFPTPEDLAVAQARGQYLGRARGLQEALRSAQTPEERQIALELAGFSSGGLGAGEQFLGNVQGTDISPQEWRAAGLSGTPDPDQVYRRTRDRVSGLSQFYPVVSGGAGRTRPLTTREAIAVRDYGRPGEDPYEVIQRLSREQPNLLAEVLKGEQAFTAGTAGAVTTARGGAAADVPLSTQQRFQAITGLQEDWRKVQAPVQEMRRSMRLIETALQRYKAGDRLGAPEAMRTAFVRLTEPTSVVMPSEYARQGLGLSLASRFQGFVERLTAGGPGVPLPEIEGMAETARQFLKGMEGWNSGEQARIEATARDFGLDPTRITGQPSGLGTAPPAPPSGLDQVVPGFFLDDQGNLIQR